MLFKLKFFEGFDITKMAMESLSLWCKYVIAIYILLAIHLDCLVNSPILSSYSSHKDIYKY